MRKNVTAVIAITAIGVAAAAHAQGSAYWLVKEVKGHWEYRVGTEKPRVLTGQYEPLAPAGEVRCLETDLQLCELRYLANPRSSTTERLAVHLSARGQWVSLRALPPPPAPMLPATSAELVDRFKSTTRPGGSRAASGCGGELSLKSPVCGENVVPDRFTVRWRGITSGKVTILAERTDGPAALFRGSASATDGQFSDASLQAFLRKQQSAADPVDVTIRVMAEGGNAAVRLVHVSAASRVDDYQGRLKGLASVRGSAAIATRMSLALEEGMWSLAAEEASNLASLPGSQPQLELAVVGLCRSGFDEEKDQVRRRVSAARFDALCSANAPQPVVASASGDASTAHVAAASPAPLDSTSNAAAPTSSSTRLGIALLIGNSDYWNLPLNSVKSDLHAMSGALEAAGFQVTTKENLRTPRQFSEAIDDVLKKENATPDDMLLVYYSGHGLQLDGKSHLLSTGVSASARVAEDLRDNAQSTEDLLAQMERAIPGTRILIVEACRDNVLSSASAGKQGDRGGFAFQQDDVANTFVMFANKPGQTTPVRSDYGLMGPFTESLVYALENTSGDILDVYATAAKKTSEISPGQEPVMYRSKSIGPVSLKRESGQGRDHRARSLLNAAQPLYEARAWDELVASVTRAKAFASDPELQQRLTNEAAFAQLVTTALHDESQVRWAEAAAAWQKAGELFPAREWVLLKASVAWLMADDMKMGVHVLAALSIQGDNDVTTQARKILAELTNAFPPLAGDAKQATEAATRIPDVPEFEKVPE